MMKKNTEYMDRFESYISYSDIKATDASEIDIWIGQWKASFLIMEISRDGEILYDSIAYSWIVSDDDIASDETLTPSFGGDTVLSGYNAEKKAWFLKRDIAFADGPARVYLYGYYDNNFYTFAVIGEIVFCVLLFGILFILLVRKKINYIVRLENDIKILETGGLEHKICVEGNDELGLLARSLDNMRIALYDNINQEEQIKKANYELVVAVSHDLRTPLTALTLYLDLIKEGKYNGAEQFNLYLDKSREKVEQIKQMSDGLFERFYMEKDGAAAMEKPEKASIVFGDYLSNMIGYIDVNGFKVISSIAEIDFIVAVSHDYIGRIFDNIASNIVKYADCSEPVKLTVKEENSKLQITISNKIRPMEEKMESTEVGVKNIIVMMKKMNGSCNVNESENEYSISLIFPKAQ